jgi:hypothetical protein
MNYYKQVRPFTNGIKFNGIFYIENFGKDTIKLISKETNLALGITHKISLQLFEKVII